MLFSELIGNKRIEKTKERSKENLRLELIRKFNAKQNLLKLK